MNLNNMHDIFEKKLILFAAVVHIIFKNSMPELYDIVFQYLHEAVNSGDRTTCKTTILFL